MSKFILSVIGVLLVIQAGYTYPVDDADDSEANISLEPTATTTLEGTEIIEAPGEPDLDALLDIQGPKRDFEVDIPIGAEEADEPVLDELLNVQDVEEPKSDFEVDKQIYPKQAEEPVLKARLNIQDDEEPKSDFEVDKQIDPEQAEEPVLKARLNIQDDEEPKSYFEVDKSTIPNGTEDEADALTEVSDRKVDKEALLLIGSDEQISPSEAGEVPVPDELYFDEDEDEQPETPVFEEELEEADRIDAPVKALLQQVNEVLDQSGEDNHAIGEENEFEDGDQETDFGEGEPYNYYTYGEDGDREPDFEDDDYYTDRENEEDLEHFTFFTGNSREETLPHLTTSGQDTDLETLLETDSEMDLETLLGTESEAEPTAMKKGNVAIPIDAKVAPKPEY